MPWLYLSMISLTREEVEKIINYLDMAFEKAVNDELPVSQDGIKALIKVLSKKLKK